MSSQAGLVCYSATHACGPRLAFGQNVINRRDAAAWGPNAQFRYPLNGTGMIWDKIYRAIPAAHKQLNARMTKVRLGPVLGL